MGNELVGDVLCCYCSKPISQARIRRKAKYCTSLCRKTAVGKEWRALNQRPQMASGNTGAASELMVALDLLIKGFDVFRAVSPSCPCDLIALKNGQQYRIEVKTGSYMISGGIAFPKPRRPELFDVLAVVLLHEHKIVYQPGFEDVTPPAVVGTVAGEVDLTEEVF